MYMYEQMLYHTMHHVSIRASLQNFTAQSKLVFVKMNIELVSVGDPSSIIIMEALAGLW